MFFDMLGGHSGMLQKPHTAQLTQYLQAYQDVQHTPPPNSAMLPGPFSAIILPVFQIGVIQ